MALRRIETRKEMLSMAERTGDPELDALIQEFIKENPEIVNQPLDAMQYQPDMPGEEQSSAGMCGATAIFFADWLDDKLNMRWDGYETKWDHSIKNVTIGDSEWLEIMGIELSPEHPRSLDEHQADFLGYGDRTDPGNDFDSTHCVTIIEKDGHTYAIDWTASQYGYSEWPMVQRLDRVQDNQLFWHRDW